MSGGTAIAGDVVAVRADSLALDVRKTSNQPIFWNMTTALDLDPKRPYVIYAAVGGVIWLSSDAGATWQQSGSGLNYCAQSLQLAPSAPAIIYVATGHSIEQAVPHAKIPRAHPIHPPCVTGRIGG